MAEFFKQLFSQIQSIWTKLNRVQQVILGITTGLSLLGIVALAAWSSLSEEEEDNRAVLFSNLAPGDAAEVTEALKESKIKFVWANQGRTLEVSREDLYEARMQLAKSGLPRTGKHGYHLFDELQLGMTDFVQNLNYQRALEGEIGHTIETLAEVEKARIHLTLPKPSLFTEKKVEATASVVLKLKPGGQIGDRQIRGIAHLVASSVEGLVPRQVSILDVHGNLLTQGFADNAIAEQADHNMVLQKGVETHLEKKLVDIFDGLLGPNKTRVKVHVDLDFEQVDKTIETYTPTSKVVRSQQREDGNVKNSPATGDEQSETSITNYEIDKTVARIVNAPGMRKRVTVSLVVDGTYKADGEGDKAFSARSTEEMDKYREIVQNTVGFRAGTEDAVFVTNVQFDRQFYQDEREAIERMERWETYQYWTKVGVICLLIALGFLFLRGLSRHIAAAMNPPIPQYAAANLEPVEEELPENVLRQTEILERVESITRDNPSNVASLIKGWLHEEDIPKESKKK